MVIGANQVLKQIPNFSLTVGNSCVEPSESVKNLGVVMTKSMSSEKQVLNTCRSANIHLRNIGRIRKYIDTDTTKLLVHSCVTSRLDYCNSLINGIGNVGRLQKTQNRAARLVTRTHIHDHISPILKNLHWLPVKQRIKYKILILTHQAVYDDDFPVYIKELITKYYPARYLRSETKNLLLVPSSSSKSGSNAFAANAPVVWNSMPEDLRSISDFSTIKSKLKTFLFSEAYNQ